MRLGRRGRGFWRRIGGEGDYEWRGGFGAWGFQDEGGGGEKRRMM